MALSLENQMSMRVELQVIKSIIHWSAQLKETQELKARPVQGLSRKEALKLATQAAELQMKFMRVAVDEEEKSELTNKVISMLDQAERIKRSENWDPKSSELLIDLEPLEPISFSALPPTPVVDFAGNPKLDLAAKSLPVPESSREVSKQEQLLLRGLKPNKNKFPPWEKPPNPNEFQLGAGKVSFLDIESLSLSKEQQALLDDWKRPSEALPPPSWGSFSNHESIVDSCQPIMKAIQKVDLVQDAATDCSVVASLSTAIARFERGHSELLASNIYPFDTENRCPMLSANGKYVVRLQFNGCWRKVVIDDRLPVSKTSRTLHVVDRNNPALLWPALLEKAYLKVRGGYDFSGSNSNTDLWVLTGWIPELIFLQHDETDSGRLWARVYKAFSYGDVLITMGTGKMSQETESNLGLAGEHDYAVLDLKEVNGKKLLLIKNAWLKATAWKGYRVTEQATNEATETHNSDLDDDEWASAPSALSDDEPNGIMSRLNKSTKIDDLSPGTFWMELNSVYQDFECIYLNWNPGLFKHRQDIHFVWDLSLESTNGRSPQGSFNSNPQYVVDSSQGGVVWLLLCKHVGDKPQEKPHSPTGEGLGFISLYAFANHGKRVSLSKGALKQGPYVDSLQTLLALELTPQLPYTIVVSEEALPASLNAFTLSVFSSSPVRLATAERQYSKRSSIKASWTQSTAGGNAGSPTYSQNPQFKLNLQSPSPISLLLETFTEDLSVHVKLLHGHGQRVYSLTSRDIIVDSGEYRRGCALAEFPTLEAGSYTIICSTFEAGQRGSFTLSVGTDVDAQLSPIPREGGGRMQTRLADASFRVGIRAVAAPIEPRRLTRLNLKAQHVTPSTSALASEVASPNSPIRLSIELGRGPTRQILISSAGGMYSDAAGGVKTEDVDLRPDQVRRHDMWLVLERLAGVSLVNKVEERVSVEFFTDVIDPIAVGVWRDWE